MVFLIGFNKKDFEISPKIRNYIFKKFFFGYCNNLREKIMWKLIVNVFLKFLDLNI